jgi:hypothetical protein
MLSGASLAPRLGKIDIVDVCVSIRQDKRMNRASTENGPKLRDTGLKAVGEVPWGTHFSIFYDDDRPLSLRVGGACR